MSIARLEKKYGIRTVALNQSNVYALIGDSQMNGAADDPASVNPNYAGPMANAKIFYFSDRTLSSVGTWQFLRHNYNDYPGYVQPNDTPVYGATLSFMYQISVLSKKMTGAIKMARGGSSIVVQAGSDNDWNNSSVGDLADIFFNNIYPQAMNKFATDGFNPTVRAFVVSLGTNDCVSGIYNDTNFKAGIQALCTRIRTVTGNPSLPIYWRQIRSDLANATIQNYPQANITAARLALVNASTVGNGAYIPGLTLLNYDNNTTYPIGPDLVHFSATGYDAIGLYEANIIFADTRE